MAQNTTAATTRCMLVLMRCRVTRHERCGWENHRDIPMTPGPGSKSAGSMVGSKNAWATLHHTPRIVWVSDVPATRTDAPEPASRGYALPALGPALGRRHWYPWMN